MDDLDNLLADLERATDHLRLQQTKTIPSSSNYSRTQAGPSTRMASDMSVDSLEGFGPPNTKTSSMTTTTRRRYDYLGNDAVPQPLYENDVTMTTTRRVEIDNLEPSSGTRGNLRELDNLLDDLNSSKIKQQTNGHSILNGGVNGSTSPKKLPMTPQSSLMRPLSPKSQRSVRINSKPIIEPPPEIVNRSINGHEKSPSPILVRKNQTTKVNEMVSKLEFSLSHPEQVPRGREVKPITMTRLVEESTVEEVIPQHTIPGVQQVRLNSPRQPAAASNATRELDDLMSSLSDFKKKEQRPSSGYGKLSPRVQQQPLDSMIGNLSSELKSQGVETTSKGFCFACNKPIVGQVLTALGRTYHPEHFSCYQCNEELGTLNFFERDGRPYCERDYHQLFSPRCAYCNQPIIDKVVTALDKTWHPEHFFCAQCGRQFNEGGFHEKDGKAYCREDYFDLFAPKCGGCQQPIVEDYISALNTQWHPECFVCRECRCPFNGGAFFEHDGQPYCEVHYHALRGSLCAGCHKPITGRCITAMFRKWHPEHFVCSFCLKQLNKGTFKEHNDKPYCHGCFEKLFA